MPRYQTTLNLPVECADMEGDIEVEVAYDVTWGRPAQTSGPAENCHPAEPDEVDHLRVTKIDGCEAMLPKTADHYQEIIWRDFRPKLLEAAAQQGDDGPDPDDARDRAYDDSLYLRVWED